MSPKQSNLSPQVLVCSIMNTNSRWRQQHFYDHPLQKLATRVLSISANSASCERLFSNFGTILTKLRSHLAPKHMMNLAELRMHLRDEYVLKTYLRERLRRKRHLASTVATTEGSATPVVPVDSSSHSSTTVASSSESTQQVLPSTSEPASRDEPENNTDSDDDSFDSITSQLQERSLLDDEGGSHDFTLPLEKNNSNSCLISRTRHGPKLLVGHQ